MSIPVVRGLRNSSVALTWTNGAATQFVDMSNFSDPDTIILVRNNNATAGQIATVTVTAGTGLAAPVGPLVVEVPINGAHAVIGPLEGVRFANMTNSRVTINLAVAAGGALASVQFAVLTTN